MLPQLSPLGSGASERLTVPLNRLTGAVLIVVDVVWVAMTRRGVVAEIVKSVKLKPIPFKV